MRVRVALAQINPTAGDLQGNCEKILAAIQASQDRQADIVVFPEMALTGYCLDEKLLINGSFLRQNRQILRERIVPACTSVAAVVGFIDFDEERVGPDDRMLRYNAAAIIQSARVLQVVHKRLLPNYRYFDDKRYFQPGTRVEPAALKVPDGEVSLGVLICEDLWDEHYAVKPSQTYCEKGAQVLACINASPFVASRPGQENGKRFIRQKLVTRQVERCGLPLIYVNTVGVGDNGKNVLPFDGHSFAYDGRGTLVASLAQFEEDLQVVEFNDGQAKRVDEAPFHREKEIFEALVLGVRGYYEKVGVFDGALEAISGGIDSALGATVAAEALGRERLTFYNLPSRFNRDETRDAAKQLAENLEVEYRIVPIQELFELFEEKFVEYLHPIRQSVTKENLQARIRGLIMMAESNDLNALLLTNGNETELALGYATLYGDMVGGLSVIGDLNKPDVYRVARYYNERRGREIIPRQSLQMPASAELSEDQVDPYDYEVVGPLISEFIEEGRGPTELTQRFQEKALQPPFYPEDLYDRLNAEQFRDLVARLYATLNRSVYKRMQAAPIIVVSERAFGFDLRETIINGWKAVDPELGI